MKFGHYLKNGGKHLQEKGVDDGRERRWLRCSEFMVFHSRQALEAE